MTVVILSYVHFKCKTKSNIPLEIMVSRIMKYRRNSVAWCLSQLMFGTKVVVVVVVGVGGWLVLCNPTSGSQNVVFLCS